jgi:hypothetical protein
VGHATAPCLLVSHAIALTRGFFISGFQKLPMMIATTHSDGIFYTIF